MSKILKNTLLFMVMAVMLLAGTVTAYAAEGIENPYIETISGASVMGTSPVIFRDTSTGMPAYCIDYNRGIPSPESLTGEFDPMTIFDPDTYKGLENLLLAGYPFETGGLSSAEAQACTQLAVWCWTYETLGYGLDANRYTATSGREDVYTYFTGLMEAARNQTPPDIGIDCTDIEMLINGDTLTGTTTVTLRNLQSGYTIDESLLPDGITVSGFTGGNGDVLTFTAPMSYSGESVTIENLFTGQDTRSALNLFWYDNSNPSQQRMVISYLDETTIAVAAGVSLRFEEMPEPEYGNIKLLKIASENENPLAGAVFGVFRAEDDTKVCELESGEDGTAISPELPLGDYYLLELQSPENYLLSEDRIYVTVTANETAEITAVNFPVPLPEPTEGKIKLIKKDFDDGTLLADAVFGVYRIEDDVKVCELETADDGTAISPLLPMGDYYLKELTAPDTYVLSTEKYGVTVKTDETVEITITNKKTPAPDPEPTEGRIKLIKKDAENGKLLGNAVFGVYRASDDVKVCELETTSRGEAISPLLPMGDYYLKELKSPDNYELSAEKHGVTVKAGETVEITITNKRTPAPTPDAEPTEGRIKLIKKDAENGNLLGNAVFGVYRASDDVKVCELETTSRGEAVSPLLPKGDYYLKELKSPDTYELSTEKYGVTVKAGETVEITITNKRVPVITPAPTPTPKPTPTPAPTPAPSDPTGKLELLKKAEQTSKPLAGAIFGVYRASDDAKVAELTTNADGKAEISLPTGDFYLLELKAPYGYRLEKVKIYFTVVKDSTVIVEVTNEREETFTDPGTPLTPIEVPKTGTTPPYLNYAFALLAFGTAAYFGTLYLRRKEQEQAEMM